MYVPITDASRRLGAAQGSTTFRQRLTDTLRLGLTTSTSGSLDGNAAAASRGGDRKPSPRSPRGGPDGAKQDKVFGVDYEDIEEAAAYKGKPPLVPSRSLSKSASVLKREWTMQKIKTGLR